MNLEKIVQPLGMDTSGYKKGILDAIKGSTNLTDAFKKITSSSMIMGGLVVASIGAIVAAGKKGTDEFINYANEVRNVMQVTGQGAEASSKLIQVLDDLKVSTDDMNKAQKAFTKEGLQMSIQTLGKLSDQYRGLTSATERADFMQKNFGKDWKKWVETMEQGSVALNKANDAQNGNLILTERSIQEARLYEKEVDNLTDAWHGFWVELGSNVVHAISEASIAQATNNILIEQGNGLIIGLMQSHVRLSEAQQATYDAAHRAAEAQLLEGDTASETAQKIRDEKAALDELTAKNNEFIGVVGGVADENLRYNDAQAEGIAKSKDLQAQKAELIAKGYSPESEAIKDIDKQLAENRKALMDNKEAHKDWINARVGDLLLARLSQDGLTDDETAYYLAFMTNTKQMTQADAKLAMDIVGQADKISTAFDKNTEDVDQFHTRLYALMERYQRALKQAEVPIHYEYSITGHGSFPTVPSGGNVNFGGGGGGGGGTVFKKATGGAVFAGHSVIVGELGKPEMFTPNTSGRIDPIKTQPNQPLDLTNRTIRKLVRGLGEANLKAA